MSQGLFLRGYMVLAMMILSGFGGGTWLGWTGLQIYFGQFDQKVESGRDAITMSNNLETALLYWSFALLLALLGIGSTLVAGFSIADDLSRRRRGPVTGGRLIPDQPHTGS